MFRYYYHSLPWALEHVTVSLACKNIKNDGHLSPSLFGLPGVWAPGPGCALMPSVQQRAISLHWFGNIQGGSGNI